MEQPPFVSSPEIDAQYNAAAAVADSAEQLRRHGELSAEARARLRCIEGIAYGPTLDETLDVFPAERPAAPVFVFIHGGYWRRFAARDYHLVALGLVPRGVTTVVVDYSLCPKVTIDEIVRQWRGRSGASASTAAIRRASRSAATRPAATSPRCASRRAGTRTTASRATRSPPPSSSAASTTSSRCGGA